MHALQINLMRVALACMVMKRRKFRIRTVGATTGDLYGECILIEKDKPMSCSGTVLSGSVVPTDHKPPRLGVSEACPA